MIRINVYVRTALEGLTREASEKLRKGNYERIFDEARKKVRNWKKCIALKKAFAPCF